MNTNTLSKEAETRLMNFFNKTIEPETMAKTLRQVNYILALGIMREHETLQNEIGNLENGYYWLNELAEILNPYLDKEQKFRQNLNKIKNLDFKKSRFFYFGFCCLTNIEGSL